MNWYDSLAGIIAELLLWAFQDLLIMLYIHLNAKKKWNKHKRTYPYFSNNFVKKIISTWFERSNRYYGNCFNIYF